MRRWIVVLLAALAAIGVAVAALVAALHPPALPVPKARSGVYRGVTLVEPGRSPRVGQTLRVEDGRIRDIRPDSDDDSGAAASPYAGFFVLPGLIDMHVHYPPRIAVGNAELWSLLFLSHGVTAVREVGSIDGSIFAVRDAIRGGLTPGPRIFACGEVLDGPQPSFPSNRVVPTPEAAIAAVREQVAHGADCIKVYNMLSAPVHQTIREEAQRAGVPLIGHVPHEVGPERAGIDDVQHLTGTTPPERAHQLRTDFLIEDWASVDDTRIQRVVQIALTGNVAHTPTLANARLRRKLAYPAEWSEDSALRHLPHFWDGVWRTLWGAPFRLGDAASEAAYDHFRERSAALTRALWKAGGRIHAGTDTLMPYVAPGSALHAELEALHDAGLPREAVWRVATRDAGHWLGGGPGTDRPAAGLGTLTTGAPADLVFYRGNPLRDPSAATRIAAVVADGRLYTRETLDRALARYDAHFHGRLYGSVMNGLTAAIRSHYGKN